MSSPSIRPAGAPHPQIIPNLVGPTQGRYITRATRQHTDPHESDAALRADRASPGDGT